MGGALEDALGGDEPLRHVLQRALPQLRRVVGVVVVDEYHGVGWNSVSWKEWIGVTMDATRMFNQ